MTVSWKHDWFGRRARVSGWTIDVVARENGWWDWFAYRGTLSPETFGLGNERPIHGQEACREQAEEFLCDLLEGSHENGVICPLTRS